MGATAITVLAGAKILNLPAALPVVRATAGFVEGFSYALWAFGTWWIPLLVVLGVWRHVRQHWPLTYEPTLWSVVFPLGMYSVATLTFGKAARLPFMHAGFVDDVEWVGLSQVRGILVSGCVALRLPLPGTVVTGSRITPFKCTIDDPGEPEFGMTIVP